MKCIRKGKKVFLLVFLLVLCLMIASCGGGSGTAPTSTNPAGETTPSPVTETKILRLAFISGEEDYAADGIKAFAEALNEKTEGRYEIEIGWSGAYGAQTEYYDLVKNGLVDIAYFLPQWTPGVFPKATIGDLPWHFPSADISTEAFNQIYKEYVEDDLLRDIKIINIHAGAGDSLFTVKPMDTIQDIKGRKIIVGGEIKSFMITALDAAATTIPHAERYGAMQKGVADGILNPWFAVSAWKFEEVVKYSMELDVGNTYCFFMMNYNSFNNMNPEDQAILDEIAETVLYGRIVDGYRVVKEKGIEAFSNAGGEIVKPTASDFDAINAALSPVWTDWIARQEAAGLPGKEALDKVYNILEGLGVDNPAYGYKP